MEIDILARYRIRDLIQKSGLTQRKAADLSGIPYSTFVNYLQGRNEITLPILHQIAKGLGKPPEYFIAADQERTSLSQEIANLSQNLSERDQQELLALIRIKEQMNRAASGKIPEAESKKVRRRRDLADVPAQ